MIYHGLFGWKVIAVFVPLLIFVADATSQLYKGQLLEKKTILIGIILLSLPIIEFDTRYTMELGAYMYLFGLMSYIIGIGLSFVKFDKEQW